MIIKTQFIRIVYTHARAQVSVYGQQSVKYIRTDGRTAGGRLLQTQIPLF